MKYIILLSLTICFGSFCLCQNLERNAALGAYIQPLNPEVAGQMGLSSAKGVLVTQVIPSSTASNLKLQANDIIIGLNGQDVTDIQTLQQILQTIDAGDQVTIEVVRSEKHITLSGKAEGRPYMQMEGAEVIYDEVAFEDAYSRAIIYKPENGQLKTTEGKYPVIYILQGYPCHSIDNLSPNSTYRKTIEYFVKKGYVIFMVEKPGMGDSEGYDCSQIDFDAELANYKAGFRHMKAYDFMNKDAIYLFGISLGAFQAPLISSEYDVKGVIAWGVGIKPWHDYLLDLFRIQKPLSGADIAENEELINEQYRPFLYKYFYESKTPAELAATGKYDNVLQDLNYSEDQILHRHYTFWQNMNKHNLYEAWKETDAHVLAMYGESDVQALYADGAQDIVEVVNHYHPDKATFISFPQTDHLMVRIGSKEDYLRLHQSPQYQQLMDTNFNYEVLETIHEWIQNLPE